MGAGADILARLDELQEHFDTELAALHARLDRLELQAPAPAGRAAGARATLSREQQSRARLAARERWVRQHLPDLVADDQVDPFAIWAIGELQRDGNDVTEQRVRALRAARVAALEPPDTAPAAEEVAATA